MSEDGPDGPLQSNSFCTISLSKTAQAIDVPVAVTSTSIYIDVTSLFKELQRAKGFEKAQVKDDFRKAKKLGDRAVVGYSCAPNFLFVFNYIFF
jgi:hypothetical protein